MKELNDFQAIHARHKKIDEGQIHLLMLKEMPALMPIFGGQDTVSRRFERSLEGHLHCNEERADAGGVARWKCRTGSKEKARGPYLKIVPRLRWDPQGGRGELKPFPHPCPLRLCSHPSYDSYNMPPCEAL